MKTKDTIRRQRLIKNIPKSDTLAEAGVKSGYSPKSKAIYSNSMKEYIKGKLEIQGFDKIALKREFERIANLCESKQDYSNLLRALENIQKYHLRDNNATNVALFNLNDSDSKILSDRLAQHKTQAVEVIDVAGNEASTIEDSTSKEGNTTIKGKS